MTSELRSRCVPISPLRKHPCECCIHNKRTYFADRGCQLRRHLARLATVPGTRTAQQRRHRWSDQPDLALRALAESAQVSWLDAVTIKSDKTTQQGHRRFRVALGRSNDAGADGIVEDLRAGPGCGQHLV